MPPVGKNKVNPLSWNVPIVNKDGTPTNEFQRKWLQQAATNSEIIPLDTPAEVSAVLDILGGARGDLLYRGSTMWGALVAGATANLPLVTGGPGADPAWATNVNVPGWLNVGATGAPANTTDGDLTSTRAFIDSTTILGTGVTTTLAGGSALTWGMSGESSVLYNFTRTSSDANAPNMRFRKARGTIAAQTKVSLSDNLGALGYFGYTGAGFTLGVSVTGIVLEPTAGIDAAHFGTELRVLVNPIGSASNTTVAKLNGANEQFLNPMTVGALSPPTTSAVLDCQSTTGAFMPPRMTTTQRNALTASNGMEVYDTTVGAFFDYAAGAWVQRGAGGGTGANPTATAGPAAINGSATTFMRSDAAPAIQKASASQFGIVEVDGTTITSVGGVISAIGGGATPSGFILAPDFGQNSAASGPAYNWAPVFLKAGTVVTGCGFLPRATNGTVTWAAALYADLGGTSSAPGTLLASSTGVSTGVTAGTLAASNFSTPYTVPTAGIYWMAFYISASVSISACVGQGGFHTTGAAFPFTTPAPSNTNATTRSVFAY